MMRGRWALRAVVIVLASGLLAPARTPTRAAPAPQGQVDDEELRRYREKLGLPDPDSMLVSWAVSSVVDLVEDVRAQLIRSAASDTALKARLSSLRVKITADPTLNPNAGAWRAAGEDLIYIDMALAVFIKGVARLTSFAVGEGGNLKYTSWFVNAWQQAALDEVHHGRKVPVFQFPLDSLITDKAMEAVLESYADEVYRMFLAFVLLHEVGHHVLGHTDERTQAALTALPKRDKLARQRELELKADRWAVQRFMRLGYDPTLLRLGLAALASVALEPSEDDSDHPSWWRRSHAVNEEIMSTGVPSPPTLLAFAAFVQTTRPATGGHSTEKISLVFVRDPARYPVPLAVISRDEKMQLGICEQMKGGMRLLFRTPHGIVEIELKDLETSFVQVSVKERTASGVLPFGTGFAHRVVIGAFASAIPQLENAMTISPATAIESLIKRLRVTVEMAARIRDIYTRRLAQISALFVNTVKTQTPLDQVQRAQAAIDKEFEAALRAVLGDSKYKEYEALVLENPMVQLAMSTIGKPTSASPIDMFREFRAAVVSRVERTPWIRHEPKTGYFREDFEKKLGLFDAGRHPDWPGYANDYLSQTIGGARVVVDRSSNLMWQRSGATKAIRYAEAQAYIKDLNARRHAGFSDWRLPTLDEAWTLLEPEYFDSGLYIQPAFDKAQTILWSADQATGFIHGINFRIGMPVLLKSDEEAHVRAVRLRLPDER